MFEVSMHIQYWLTTINNKKKISTFGWYLAENWYFPDTLWIPHLNTKVFLRPFTKRKVREKTTAATQDIAEDEGPQIGGTRKQMSVWLERRDTALDTICSSFWNCLNHCSSPSNTKPGTGFTGRASNTCLPYTCKNIKNLLHEPPQ